MGEARRRFAVASFECDGLDRLMRSDEHYFSRTGRSHRLRLAGHAEVDALRRAYGADATRLDNGERFFVVVKRANVGGHLKAFTPNEAGAETDVPEAFAAGLFEHFASRGPEMAVIEAAMRRAADMGARD